MRSTGFQAALQALGLPGVLMGCLACQSRSAPSPRAAQSPANEVWLTASQVTQSGIKLQSLELVEVSDPVVVSGRVTLRDSQVAHVVSPVSGRVLEIYGGLGQHVKLGERLLSLNSPDLDQTAADVQRARADLQAATRAFDRQKILYEQHAAARRDFEAAEDVLKKSRAEHARAQQKMVWLHLDTDDMSQNFQLRAPIAGEILARNVNPGAEVSGQYSGGNAATELFTVGSLTTVCAVGYVFEMDWARVHLGDRVQMQVVTYPERVFTGSIDYVGTSLDPNTRTAQIRCTMGNPHALLKPEMFATLRVFSPRGKMLAIPRRSLFRQGTRTVVFIKTSQNEQHDVRFVRREVLVDEKVTGDLLPVHAGLTAGDTIVTAGGILLTEMF